MDSEIITQKKKQQRKRILKEKKKHKIEKGEKRKDRNETVEK